MGVLWLGKKAIWLIVLFKRCLEACLCHCSYNKFPLPLRDTTQIFRLGPHWFVKTLGWESPSRVRGPSLTSQESLRPPPPAASPLNTSHNCCRLKPSWQVFWARDILANSRTHKEHSSWVYLTHYPSVRIGAFWKQKNLRFCLQNTVLIKDKRWEDLLPGNYLPKLWRLASRKYFMTKDLFPFKVFVHIYFQNDLVIGC